MASERSPDSVTLEHWLASARQCCAEARYEAAHALCMQVLEHAQAGTARAQIAPEQVAPEQVAQQAVAQEQVAQALALLSGIAFAHGNFARAENILLRALASINALPGADSDEAAPARAVPAAPGSANSVRAALLARLHAQLAQALSMQDKTAAAVSAARSAARLAPADALTCDSIGVVLSRAAEHADALPYFARAVQLAPRNAEFQYNYAAALQFTGDLAAAEAAYARALALDPALHRAYPAYAQLHGFQPADARDDRWQQQLTQRFASVEQQGTPNDALLLGHALATTLEKRRAPVAALRALQRAKQRYAHTLHHDPQLDRALFAAADALLHAAPHPQPSTLASTAPIFVMGLPRSGTTLVERILSSHSLVQSAGELPDFSATVKQLTRTPGPFVLDAATLHAALHVPPEDIGREYLQRTGAFQQHAEHFIDKMPLNFFYAELIHRALPQARIICLRRQPMDAALGNYRQLFSTRFPYYNYAYDLTHTAHYVAQFELYRQKLHRTLPADKFLSFDYDALVRAQERETRQLLAFCGLPWEAGCLSFQHNNAAVATASSAQVRQPLYASASGRWRQYGEALDTVRAVFESFGLPIA